MRTRGIPLWLIVLVLTAVLVLAVSSVATARPDADGAGVKAKPWKVDNKPHPLGVKQAALKQTALEMKLKGKVKGDIVQVAEGQFVKLDLENEDPVWTVLAEFSDLLHNQSPEPDRTYDNTSIWVEDFSRDYYLDLLFNDEDGANSMRNYFLEQSSGRYTVKGDVSDWVQVPNGYEYYDDSKGGEDTSTDVWLLLEDMLDEWYADQVAAGKSEAEIAGYLAQFDVWDRYDYNGNGNFYEPDGYIDHFQALHAGDGEEGNGGPAAIWSHSWYANYQDYGKTGPSYNPAGGVQVGDSDFWVGDYTIQPEMGGLGVFVHEFSHDLGLPDLYDYNYNENGTGFWTLMSSGSWLDESPYQLGNKPCHLGAWEKFMLGWLNYGVAYAGESVRFTLGPAEYNTSALQGVLVVLPDRTVTETVGAPYAGSYFYFSGAGDNLRNKMYKQFTLPAGATLSAMVNYAIEEDYDYANLIVSTDGGTTWNTVPANLSNSSVEPNGIDGFSGGWVPLTADLSAYTGDVLVGFGYFTDGGVAEAGFMVDEISISGYPTDGAETDAGWTYHPAEDGFRATTGTETRSYSHYYLAENRVYWGYDNVLRVGPYNFGFLNDPMRQNFVEHFPYQDGMLVSYWNTQYRDNNTNPSRPGTGMLLYVDSHPQSLKRPDGNPWRNRVQTYDATFSLQPTDPITLHFYGKLSKIKSLPAVREFNDLKSYYDNKNPYGSVIVPKTGTKITITGTSASGRFIEITVSVAKSPAK
jgi:immune inhibitor A